MVTQVHYSQNYFQTLYNINLDLCADHKHDQDLFSRIFEVS